jgi:large subunit ribosomal protein L10
MNRQEKEVLVEELRAELAAAPAVVVATSQGMSVNAVNDMRTKLRKSGIRYRVLKNTLSKIAMEGTPMTGLYPHLKGFTALVYHPSDPVVTAKVLSEIASDSKFLKIKAGYLNGSVFDASGVDALAKLPSQDQLRAMLLSTMNAVGTKFVRVLIAGPQSLANVLNARKDSLAG